jgi:predicted nucleic acid-binding Zn ribbon protein
MQQAANPICRTCGTAMILNRIIPCAADYDIWSYDCPECTAVFSMVEARTADRSAVHERRVVLRHPIAASATIAWSGSAIACMVRNLSAAGACLGLPDQALLPNAFTLTTGGSALPCHAIWRREKQIGIAFD